MLPAEGAVSLIQRFFAGNRAGRQLVGAIGTAVYHAIVDLVPVIAGAPADARVRDAWLERLWAAHEADQMPYIEAIGDYWGIFVRREKWRRVGRSTHRPYAPGP